ncbi:coronin-2B isoform X1 [Xenopus tropicalis]|uniref:Coronin n=1 Tax=Xenopus tropicalis TaxID=8364 RepID=A0A6I8PP11_XENTR|nr:coronin-2B isoform X1 [Xenopus tropicalis]|eukprot:XP_012814523.1 PREDICTED: coronin-2B isoform X1 [Xenopus tropicalis]
MPFYRPLYQWERPPYFRLKMSWRPQYRCSKFRNVYGKVASRENCYDCIPITKNVHDNHFCAVNPKFLAIVTETAGGGSFLVIPLQQTGRIEPNYPKVCGHQGTVLDIKWNPFIENIIASCSEDTSVRIWEIPDGGLKRNMSEAVLELYGHSRRVGLIEWHPTAINILFSAGYDYKILIWNLDIGEAVKMIDCHRDVILCMSFNTDGSLLATTCKDKKLRVLEPRSGRVLQETACKTHKVTRVVFLGDMKRLFTTGVSKWNTRQMALWDQEDLSMPVTEEEIDGLSGLLFPFYDADTHMLYLAGKGDGNIRYYEITAEKPYLTYLMEFRSPAPQKGLGVMPKHGLDVSACEIFRFYKLITLKNQIEPISMIVPRRSENYQEDIYPMTSGTEPALRPEEWLRGVNKGPVLMSLKEGYRKENKAIFIAPVKEKKSLVVNGIDLLENVPPRTENELLRMFFRQQEEIRRLKEQLSQRDLLVRQLELELKNLRNSPKDS